MVRPDKFLVCLWIFVVGCSGEPSAKYHTFPVAPPLAEANQTPVEEPLAPTTANETPAHEPSSPPDPLMPPAKMPEMVQAAVSPSTDPDVKPSESDKVLPASASGDAPVTSPTMPRLESKPPAAILTLPGKPMETMVGSNVNAPGNSLPGPLGPLPIKLLIPQKEFVPEGSEKSLRVSFDDLDLLKVLNMEPVPPNPESHFPDWLKQLNGQRIILRGWMFPAGRADGISSFLFVRDNGICCFGRNPKVYDKLGVKLRPGTTTHYIQNRPFDVIGTLSIEPEIDGPDEGDWWLYFLNDAVVIDH